MSASSSGEAILVPLEKDRTCARVLVHEQAVEAVRPDLG
jgi:hypothetical protein